MVKTNGDGMKFVTSGSPGVCTVGSDGITVHYVGLGDVLTQRGRDGRCDV